MDITEVSISTTYLKKIWISRLTKTPVSSPLQLAIDAQVQPNKQGVIRQLTIKTSKIFKFHALKSSYQRLSPYCFRVYDHKIYHKKFKTYLVLILLEKCLFTMISVFGNFKFYK